ncbi:glycosyltransferase family 4 protein [Kitasatospora sp. MAP5-34]|uniref:glycosyltransferase family 4 protein n=1 Tax=Kitasatospora sp. MAP5-34 TaxID=3035102 RepID=UPI0024736B22|nr:glycosyltransferase family 4 protein [Kitasatospora sp. MAP5-34]MDH6578064.1 glycosyltransferase involved in cell wall biosynthesis [Kitasatospora sp. MAP5-34]
MSARRTVAVVAPYYPPKIGGVESYAARIAAALAAAPDLRPVVITTRPDGLRTTVSTEDGVQVVRLGAWLRLSNTPLSPLWPVQLRYWLRRTGAEVVNAHAPVPGLGDLAVAMSGRRPVVLTYHAGSMHKGEPGSGAADRVIGLYERHLLPRVFRRARRLVAVSPVSLAAGRPHAVEITPGVDTDRFTPGEPASGRPRTVLYVGRMDRTSAWKGVDVLVRAFAELAELPGARLRLVGGGDAVPDHLALAGRLGVADRVDAVGELTGDALVAEVRTAALLVLPSRTEAESFGMALVEAMACGTPVVGSEVGGIPHVITDGETGLLVPPGDPGALATACRRVLEDGGLADRLAGAGRRRAVERYAWDGLMARYLSLFRSA